MSDAERLAAEDAFELAETRRLAAEDAYELLRRLHRHHEAEELEVLVAEEALRAAVVDLEGSFLRVAAIAADDLRQAVDANVSRGADYAVAVKVECGWADPSSGVSCTRIAGRVVVVEDERWFWIDAGAGMSTELGDVVGGVTGSCSKHGGRRVGPHELEAVVVVARRRRNRWPIVESAD